MATRSQPLDALYLHPPQSVHELPCTTRAFMGYLNQLGVPSPYSGEFEQAGPHELDRHFNFSPALDPLVWGGAYADDPWPELMPETSRMRVIMLSRERRAQLRGTVARLSRRAQFSRAHVGYEIHQTYSNPLVEAITALARHEHPLARLAALDLGYVIASAHREAALALARERAEQDREFAEHWQRLVESIAA